MRTNISVRVKHVFRIDIVLKMQTALLTFMMKIKLSFQQIKSKAEAFNTR